MSGLRDVLVALASGVAATRLMEVSDRALLERQDRSARRRERRIRGDDEGPTFARRAAGLFGLQISDGASRLLGQSLHYSFGAMPCLAVMSVARRRGHPLAAGLAVALVQFALIDELAHHLLGLTAAPRKWPVQSHLRGVANHLVYGVALGLGAAVVTSRDRSRPTRNPVFRSRGSVDEPA